jgi:hypothetical protein
LIYFFSSVSSTFEVCGQPEASRAAVDYCAAVLIVIWCIVGLVLMIDYSRTACFVGGGRVSSVDVLFSHDFCEGGFSLFIANIIYYIRISPRGQQKKVFL